MGMYAPGVNIPRQSGKLIFDDNDQNCGHYVRPAEDVRS